MFPPVMRGVPFLALLVGLSHELWRLQDFIFGKTCTPTQPARKGFSRTSLSLYPAGTVTLHQSFHFCQGTQIEVSRDSVL